MDWRPIIRRYQDLVLRLECTILKYDPYRPALPPRQKSNSGTGFIINVQQGLVMTNAHVMANTEVIEAYSLLLGSKSLKLLPMSICHDKDIGVCRMSLSDLTLFHNIYKGNINTQRVNFGDILNCYVTQPVICLGYSLDKTNFKVATGTISSLNIDEQDQSDEVPVYIQLQITLQQGNSGSPIVDQYGHIIAIASAGSSNSEGIIEAISINGIVAIMNRLISTSDGNDGRAGEDGKINIISPPKYGFEVCPCTPFQLAHINYSPATYTLMSSSTYSSTPSSSSIYTPSPSPSSIHPPNFPMTGCLVKRVNPNCFMTDLIRGDILSQIKFLSNTFYVTEYGNIRWIDRSYISFKQFFDVIPESTVVSFIVYRQDVKIMIESPFISPPSPPPTAIYVRNHIYLAWTNLPTITVAGLILGPLTKQHVKRDPQHLGKYLEAPERYQPYMLVYEVLPDTINSDLKIIKEGAVISSINSLYIRTIDDVVRTLEVNTPYLSILDVDSNLLVVSKE